MTDHKTLRVFITKDEPKMHLSDLVVYCARAYYQEYRKLPDARTVVKATGLSTNTVKRADKRLVEMGLLDEDFSPVEPQHGLFVDVKNRPHDKHWRHAYATWDLLVRNPASSLTYVQVALLSFLTHCAKTGYQPRFGMSISYLARVLLAERETIKQALDTLRDEGLIKYSRQQGSVEYKIQAVPETVVQAKQRPSNRQVAKAKCVASEESAPPDLEEVTVAIAKHGEFPEPEARVMAQRAVMRPEYQEFPGSLMDDVRLAAIPIQLSARRSRLFTLCGMQPEHRAEKLPERPIEPKTDAPPREPGVSHSMETRDLEWERELSSIMIEDETDA